MNIQLHLITTTETITTIKDKYNCDYLLLKILNKHKIKCCLNLGSVIYIPCNIGSIPNIDSSLLKEIQLLNKEDFTSYINNFNDHILIEDELFKKYEILVSLLNLKKGQDQVLIAELKYIHYLYHGYIDELKNKDEEAIKNKQKEIKEKVLAIYKLLINHQVDLKTIIKHVEFNLLLIINLISNNYYQVYLDITR